jgi:hypothetical protein
MGSGCDASNRMRPRHHLRPWHERDERDLWIVLDILAKMLGHPREQQEVGVGLQQCVDWHRPLLRGQADVIAIDGEDIGFEQMVAVAQRPKGRNPELVSIQEPRAATGELAT